MFSLEYKALQENFHQAVPDYGVSGAKYSEQVLRLSQQLQTRNVLDYGCGKCTLAANLPFLITNYDPFIPAYAERPQPHELVVCTDVMEHVEPEYITTVLRDIASLCTKAAFFQIATREAKKVLPDGRNAHLVVKPAGWWLGKLVDYFEPVSFQAIPGGLFFLGYPLEQK